MKSKAYALIKEVEDSDLNNLISFASSNAYLELDSIGLDKSKFYEKRLHDFYEKKKSAYYVRDNKNQIFGLILFEKLDFDTNLFKVETFRITDLVVSQDLKGKDVLKIASLLLDAADKEMKSTNAKFIQCKLDAMNQHLAKVFQNQHYFLASEDVTLCKELSNIKYAELMKDYEVKFCEEKDVPALYQLSKEAYKTTRFHQDPHIKSEDADEMQGRWIKNCYYQKLADEIIIIKDKKNNELCSYVACSVLKDEFENGKKVGRIVLIATHDKHRGKGIGTLVISESDKWFAKQGCEEVVVGTQTINAPALNFYQKNSFRIINHTLSFHKWL